MSQSQFGSSLSLKSCILHDFFTTLYLVFSVHNISLGNFLFLINSSSTSSSVLLSSSYYYSFSFSLFFALSFFNSAASSYSRIFSNFSSTIIWLLSAITNSSLLCFFLSGLTSNCEHNAGLDFGCTITVVGDSSSSRSSLSGLLKASGDVAMSVPSSGEFSL